MLLDCHMYMTKRQIQSLNQSQVTTFQIKNTFRMRTDKTTLPDINTLFYLSQTITHVSQYPPYNVIQVPVTQQQQIRKITTVS